MTVLIMTDIEGICGVDLWEQVHTGAEFARERLMADTNAAIEGAFLAGADKVYVVANLDELKQLSKWHNWYTEVNIFCV